MAMEKNHQETASLPNSARLMDFFRREVSKRRLQANKPEAYEILMVRIVEMWGAFMGDDCENQGLKNLWMDAGLEGGIVDPKILSLDETGLADFRYRQSIHGFHIQRHSSSFIPLTVREHRSTLGLRSEQDKESGVCAVTVEAADNFRGIFDDVVITAPLSWLKRSENIFSPPQVPRISTAIRSLGYGNLDKMFIKFPEVFWNNQASRSNHDHKGPVGNVTSPGFPIESLFLRPEYAADTNPAKRRQEIISFSGLPEPFSQPVIMFFVYGQWGRHITGLVRGMEQDAEEYYSILDDNFRPYYSKLPNYDPASPLRKPLKFVSIDWQGDKFAGFGSFVNLPIGSGDCFEHIEALRKGMGEDRGVWFAGEHTSPPGGLGTVTGAYWSGEEVARKVAHRWRITIDA